MTNLRRTPLRHQLLREVAEGHMSVLVGMQWNLIRGRDDWLTAAEKRTAKQIQSLITHDAARGRVPARLTEEGRALLSEWDKASPAEQHTEVES